MDTKPQFEMIDDGLLVRAPGKINLSLLVAGKRPDGFHELETIMAKIDFYDEILIQPSRRPGIEFICRGPEWAPAGPDNLVYRAAQMLLDRAGRSAELTITLTKNIPAGSGLGSGSSDAAATLMALNKFLDLPLTAADLADLADRLGSDITFFLNGPLAFCTGRGEKIRKLNEIFNFLALLILPDVSVSTKKVYENYRHDQALYQSLSARINGHISKKGVGLAAEMCANMLEISCYGMAGSLARLKAEIESLGIAPCCLSGSGSAMFCIVRNSDRETASRYRNTIQNQTGCRTIIVANNGW